MKYVFPIPVFLAAWGALAPVCATAAAQARDAPPAPALSRHALNMASGSPANVAAAAVSDAELDGMRGGFDIGQGLQASFGIQRVVYLNGNLVIQNSVNIPDVARMTTAQASALAAATTSVSVLQNGAGNTFIPAVLDHATAAMVIQNTLDNQDIKSLTTIDVSVNGLNQFQSARLADTLQSALVGSLGH